MSSEGVSEAVFLGRQAIFDRDDRLFAYELLFRTAGKNEADITNDSHATAQVIVNTMTGVGVERVLGEIPGLINIGEEFLMSDLIFLLSADHFILEILETVPVTEEVIARCQELKQKGYRLALDDYAGDLPTWEPLLPLMDFVKVDFQKVGGPDLLALAKILLEKEIPLVAEKVESPEQKAMAMNLGFSYFQGFFFSRPIILESRKRDPLYPALIKILSLILSDGEIEEIHDAIKPHIELSISLIKIANVVGRSPVAKVTGLRQAIISIGRGQMKRWIELLLFSRSSSENRYAMAVFQLAVTRARFMEILADEWIQEERTDSDQAFMTGMLSFSESLLGCQAEEILRDLPLMTEVKGALKDGGGFLGVLLALSRSIEHSDGRELEKILSVVPLPEEVVAIALSESMFWADDIVRTFSLATP
jgi:EAL and modified HD-GYP domain-containing signal transduction protein